MLRGESELGEPWARLMVLGLALLYLGRQNAVEATLEVRSFTSSCAFFGLHTSVGVRALLILLATTTSCLENFPSLRTNFVCKTQGLVKRNSLCACNWVPGVAGTFAALGRMQLASADCAFTACPVEAVLAGVRILAASAPRVAQVSRTLTERISAYAGVVLETVAYAGTGDVLKVQRLLALCGEHTEVDEASAWKVGSLRQLYLLALGLAGFDRRCRVECGANVGGLCKPPCL